MQVVERPTLEEIGREAWNALVPRSSFYLSHDWLRSVEANRSARATYLLAERGPTLLGALPVYAIEREENAFYRPELISRGWQGRYLLAGTRRAYVNDLLLRPDLDPEEREDVLRKLLDALRGLVGRGGAAGALFLYLTTEAAEALVPLLETIPLLVGAEAVLRLPGRSFDDYLASFSAARRATVRRDLRLFEAAGYDATVEPLAGLVDEVAPLLANVQRRYGHARTVESVRAGVVRQLELLGDQAVVFGCRRGGRLVGCAIGYPWGDTLFMRTVGFDYDSLTGAGEYFSVGFYQPIRYAYDHGLRGFHAGRGSYHAKVLRGAALTPLWALAAFERPRRDGQRAAELNAQAAEEHRPLLELQVGEGRHRGWELWGAGVAAPSEQDRVMMRGEP